MDMSFVLTIKKDPLFYLLLTGVVALAVFFRTYNYFDRIYIHSDHSLYAQLAKYAVDNLTIPQIGVFPQAPFFTGPEWIWILMLFYLVPLGILAPWYMMTILSLIFIFLIWWISKEMGGKWLGLLGAFLAAISTSQVDNSFAVWNAAFDPVAGVLSLVFLIRFYKYKKTWDIILLGLSVSLAISVRFQNVLMLPIFAMGLVMAWRNFKQILAGLLGFFLPLLPFLAFDLRFNWFEWGRIYDYVTIGQFRIYVPNRWLTYAGVWWPNVWGTIIGGSTIAGYAIISLLSTLIPIVILSTFSSMNVRRILRMTATKIVELKDFGRMRIFYLVAISFVLEVIMFRYYRGERLVYYSLFANAPVLVLTAWTLGQVVKWQKIIGLLLIAVVSAATIKMSWVNLQSREVTYKKIDSLKGEIYARYPNDKFDIYGCSFNGARIARPLALLMFGDGRNTQEGLPVGVCELVDKSYTWNVITQEEAKVEATWFAATTATTYKTALEWWKTNPPK